MDINGVRGGFDAPQLVAHVGEAAISTGSDRAVIERKVVLRDGSEVLIRPVHHDDAPLLVDGFARLSAESRSLRFLTSKSTLSPSELRYFTEVDHHNHEAIGAVGRVDGRGLGVARYIRSPDDPQAAEVAVVVIDEWQGRGLGTELLSQLVRHAHQEGIRRFTALVAVDNAGVSRLLKSIGADCRISHHESGCVEYEIELPPGGLTGELRTSLRAFGRQQLRPPKSIRNILHALVADWCPPAGG